MRLLVYPHDLAIGGSQINAIDLAHEVANSGHEVVVYGIPGPLVEYIERKGLRFVPARRLRYRPAPSRIVQLAMLCRRERIDLIHAYEWPPCLDSYYGPARSGTPLVSTVLGMTVTPFLPRNVPLIMGTKHLADQARAGHRAAVWALEPPIDTVGDHPDIDGAALRERYGVTRDDLLVVTVSRLAIDLKLDALVRAIDATAMLAHSVPIKLLIVGGGEAHDALLARASAINNQHGRTIVMLAGPQLDPRGAYAAADIVVGMGSSALRAAAISRAVVVQGEDGFSEILQPSTQDIFLHQGMYGRGDAPPTSTRLAKQLKQLAEGEPLRRKLGAFGRSFVEQHFSLAQSVKKLADIYRSVHGSQTAAWERSEALRCAALALKLEVKNHSLTQKRTQATHVREMLASARYGSWPPLGTSNTQELLL